MSQTDWQTDWYCARYCVDIAIKGLALAFALGVAGCATSPQQATVHDPWESWNRSVYRFNDSIDQAILRPTATTYQQVVPQPIRTGVGNFFDNLKDAWSALQHALQGKGRDAATSLLRFGVNSTFGLYGVVDIATAMRLDRQPNDFGRTLGQWGVAEGPYLVLPLLGPSTLRDTAGLVWDRHALWTTQIDHEATRNITTVVYVIDRRAQLLGATRMLDEVAIDPYVFTRDVYVQRRRSLSTDDGIPPQDDTNWDENGDDAGLAPADSDASAKQGPTNDQRSGE